MEISRLLLFSLPLLLLLMFLNIFISKDIFDWIPSPKKRASLLLLVWLFPIIGIFLANRFGDLGWFRKSNSGSDASMISGGLTGLDEIFNPGTKHIAEIIEKQKDEVRQEYPHADDKNKNRIKK